MRGTYYKMKMQPELEKFMSKYAVSGYDEMQAQMVVRAIVMGAAEGEIGDKKALATMLRGECPCCGKKWAPGDEMGKAIEKYKAERVEVKP